MPGIVGIISDPAVAGNQGRIQQMVSSLATDPAYEQRTVLASELGVVTGWVGTRHGCSGPGIYSHPQHHTTLLLAGECFPSASEAIIEHASADKANDRCHWLLEEYARIGEQCLAKSDGLFAGLIIDRRAGRVLLFNDRYGMERIYVHEARDFFYFASEAKALLRVLPEVREFDEDGIADFLSLGFTTEWKTLFRNLQVLPGGSILSFSGGNKVDSRYFTPPEWEVQSRLNADEFEQKFPAVFKRSLPRYLTCGSELGLSVTGGLDTRMIMAFLQEDRATPITYTFVGESDALSPLDATIGRKVADICNLEHHIIPLESDFFADFQSFADRTVFHTDGTLGVTGAHEMYYGARARALAPIRLTGNYGSEVLRRVSEFKRFELASGLLRPELRARIKSIIEPTPIENSASFAAFKAIPWRLYGNYAANRSEVTLRTPFLDAEIVAFACRRPKELRGSSEPAARLIQKGNPRLARIPSDMGYLGEDAGRLGKAFRYAWNRSCFKMDYYHTAGLPGKLSVFDPALDQFASRLPLFGKHKF
ncbi:MAG: hypothetical protein H0U23_04975, partial [Blastocatellia bacterium]|nr:hypothetical protein [Blastocatellia bacterium]